MLVANCSVDLFDLDLDDVAVKVPVNVNGCRFVTFLLVTSRASASFPADGCLRLAVLAAETPRPPVARLATPSMRELQRDGSHAAMGAW